MASRRSVRVPAASSMPTSTSGSTESWSANALQLQSHDRLASASIQSLSFAQGGKRSTVLARASTTSRRGARGAAAGSTQQGGARDSVCEVLSTVQRPLHSGKSNAPAAVAVQLHQAASQELHIASLLNLTESTSSAAGNSPNRALHPPRVSCSVRISAAGMGAEKARGLEAYSSLLAISRSKVHQARSERRPGVSFDSVGLNGLNSSDESPDGLIGDYGPGQSRAHASTEEAAELRLFGAASGAASRLQAVVVSPAAGLTQSSSAQEHNKAPDCVTAIGVCDAKDKPSLVIAAGFKGGLPGKTTEQFDAPHMIAQSAQSAHTSTSGGSNNEFFGDTTEDGSSPDLSAEADFFGADELSDSSDQASMDDAPFAKLPRTTPAYRTFENRYNPASGSALPAGSGLSSALSALRATRHLAAQVAGTTTGSSLP